MSNNHPESVLRNAKHVTLASVSILSLTTVHHVYGAQIYNTPWRNHAAIISGFTIAVIAVSLWLSRKRSGELVGTSALWLFTAITFLVPFLSFGVFEGIYNHGVKDVLYFANASPDLMKRLFPPPTYEMPNDVFFEVTGVLQIIPGVVTGYYLYRFVRERRRRGAESVRTDGGAR